MRNVIVGTVFALTLLVASPVMAQGFDKGWKAYQSDDFATALKEWKPLSEQGYLGARTIMAWRKDDNYRSEIKWHREHVMPVLDALAQKDA